MRREIKTCSIAALLFFLGLSLLPSVGCRSAVSDPAADDTARASLEWNRNMEVLDRAISGGAIHGDEFEKACLFFDDLTPIQVRTNCGTLGCFATEETEEDAAKLKQWYAANRGRLRWSEQQHRVVVVH